MDKISLANLDFGGLKSHASTDEWLSWEVCCGGVCLIILILIILWLVWKWYKASQQKSATVVAAPAASS